MADETGVRFGIATGVLVLALVVAGLTGLDATGTALAVILAAGIAAGLLPVPAGASLGVIAWAFFTGFDVHSYGQLTFTGPDLLRLAVFAAATVLLAAAVRGRREAGRG